MLPTDPIRALDFYTLTARPKSMLGKAIDAGDVIYWNQPARRRRSVRPFAPNGYIAFDAVLVALSDIAADDPQAIRRRGLRIALPGIQQVLGRAIDNREGLVGVGIADGRTLHVVAGRDEDDFAREIAIASHAAGSSRCDFFVGCAARWLWRTWPANEIVRDRAAEHGIELPRTFALPLTAIPARVKAGVATEIAGVEVQWGGAGSPAFARIGAN